MLIGSVVVVVVDVSSLLKREPKIPSLPCDWKIKAKTAFPFVRF